MNCTCGRAAEYEMRSMLNPEYAFAVCNVHCNDSDFDDGFSKNVLKEESD